MLILTITQKGTLRLPPEVLEQLHGAKHLKLRMAANCITLTPVSVKNTAERYAIPGAPTGQTDREAPTTPKASPQTPNQADLTYYERLNTLTPKL